MEFTGFAFVDEEETILDGVPSDLAKRKEQRAINSAQRREKAEKLKNDGNRLFKDGDYKGASRVYAQAVELFGPRPVLMSNLAAAYMKLELYEEVAWAATTALQFDPRMIKARFRRALARKAMKQFRAAMADLEVVVTRDPGCSEARNELEAIEKLTDSEGDVGDGYSFDELNWPYYDGEAWDLLSDSDSEDCNHIGNGIPCRFYNRLECNRGENCAYSHAPDNKSVRDDLGKNVCLKDLLGTCKFGATRCVYSHTKASPAMPSNGWWHDPEQVASAREIFAFAERETTDVGVFNTLVRHLPGVHGVAGRASRKIIAKHIKENGVLVSKAEQKAKSPAKSTIQASSRFVLLLSLENQEFFSSIQEHFLKAIRAKVKVVQAKSLTEALSLLSSPDLAAVFVTDPGIVKRKNKKAATKLAEYVKSGGSAAIGGNFASFVSGREMEAFFRQTFGLNWTYGAYHRTTFALNPLNEVAARNPSLANAYSMKTLHLGGISPEMAMYKPNEESRLESLVFAPVKIENSLEAPAVCTRVGQGYLGFLGDVNGEICSTNTLLAMLGFLDTSNIPLAPPEPPTTAIKTEENTGKASSSSGSSPSPKKFTLIITLEDEEVFHRIHEEQVSTLKDNDEVKTASTSAQALQLLQSPDLRAIYVADAGIIKSTNARVLTKVVEFTKSGGTLVVGGMFPSMASNPEMSKFFSAFGLSWKRGSYGWNEFDAVWTSETGKRNPSLPESYSMKAVNIESIRPSDVVYMQGGDLWDDDDDDFNVFTKPATPGFESPVLRTRVGNGYLGYVGDVNGEDESTEVVLALLDLLDPPPPIAGPSSRKFVMVLSFGLTKITEDIFSNFFAELRRRVEVVRDLSNERMVELMPSPDLVGILVTSPAIADPNNAYILSKIAEYSKAGGNVIFAGLFSVGLDMVEAKQFFFESWGFSWDLVNPGSTELVKNPQNQLTKKHQDFSEATDEGKVALAGIEPTMAVYRPESASYWNSRTNNYQSSVVFADVGQGHLGFIGYDHFDGHVRDVTLAMLGL